ncbi:ABC transporter substrate-binding protein [Thalassospira sp. TSL5-1]|nr:ABC transporter substrate-binding protein [Thalassospira sp. TSL5-1]
MLLNRRKFSLLLGTAMAVPAMAIAKTDVAPATHITDMAGRSVMLPKKVKRIVLLDARDILAIAMLHPAPSELVAGWADTARLDSEALRKTYEQRPDGTVIEVVGGSSPDTLSHEKIIALQPDLVVATAYSVPDLGTGELAQRLSRANIPIVFSNVSSNTITHTDTGSNPFDETAALMRMWGKILGSSSRAEEFIAFVDKHRRIIASRLGNVAPTKTYLEIQSTYEDCCWAAGQQIWGNLLEQASGRNLSAIKAPWYAHVSTEQLMIEAPDVYIATGGAYAADMRPAVGPGLDPVSARAGLKRLTERTGFATLPAVQNDRVHCIWTGLLTIAPLQILFLEVAAKWLHPDIFTDLDPGDTLEEINHRFLGKPLAPPCWISLKDDPTR